MPKNPRYRAWISSALVRKKLADSIRRSRRSFRQEEYLVRDLATCEAFLHLKPGQISEMIQKAINDKRRRVDVLDVGANKGVFLRSLKDRFGNNISTTSLDLFRPSRKEGIDRRRVSTIERFSESEKFDFVFSTAALMYSINRGLALHNIIHSLRVGGQAFLDIIETDIDQKEVEKLRREYPFCSFVYYPSGALIIVRSRASL